MDHFVIEKIQVMNAGSDLGNFGVFWNALMNIHTLQPVWARMDIHTFQANEMRGRLLDLWHSSSTIYEL